MQAVSKRSVPSPLARNTGKELKRGSRRAVFAISVILEESKRKMLIKN